MAVYVRCLDSLGQQCFSKVSMSGEMRSIDSVPFPERKHKIVGYCKGLFCLEYENGRCVLWNPSKNEFKFLPPSELKVPHCPSPHCPVIDCTLCTDKAVRGLGFDPSSKDYKVIRFVSHFYNHTKDCCSIKQVEVYSLIHDSWEEIGIEGEQNHVLDECATYLDGQCYWTGHSPAGDFIISLDLSSHEFSTLPLPPNWGSYPEIGHILTECDNSLAFIYFIRVNAGATSEQNSLCCWVRVDDVWVRKMVFEFGEIGRPLRFCGDFLLFQGLDGSLLAYDSHTSMFRTIEGIRNSSNCMRLFPFIKSKVPLSIVEEEEDEELGRRWPIERKKWKKREKMRKSRRKGIKKDKDGDAQ